LVPKKIAMPHTRTGQSSDTIDTPEPSGLRPALAVIIAIVLLHLFTNGRYGFFRDELQFLSDARNLDWGFVAYPPVVPLLARLSMSLFGVSLVGLRLFPTLAQAAALLLTALMTRELGGGRLAQAAATLGIGLSLYSLFNGRLFWYTTFDYLWWVLGAYFTIRLLKSEDLRWWVAIGAVEGFGLLTKYSIAYLIAGILCGAILTQAGRYLVNGWFWAGHALALLICLPNILWQFRHDFISYQFLQFVHNRDIKLGRTDEFLIEQLFCVNLFALPLVLAGLIGYLRKPRYRMIGWMYIVPLVLFIVTRARSYYLAPAYPMLVAMGSVMGERWIGLPGNNSRSVKKARRSNRAASTRRQIAWSGRHWLAAVFFAGVLLWGAWVCAIVIPFQAKGPLRDFAFKRNGNLMNEFGWNELIRSVATIRDSLPADQQAHLGIVVANYGEQGAIENFGSAYHLPSPISTINSGWLRGYPTPPPTTLIVIGFSRDMATALFSDCKLAGHNGNSEGVLNEESRYPDIFLCGPPRKSWPEFWKESPRFE
jgi:hypothetical protein